ncbi:MAG: 3'-5' exonuclease [Salinivirgaceae bacterium]|nr:3'-5' exonuclease [Salinivirgaceae bacterium]
MTNGLNFIAIDFETATSKRASICEAGICVVKNGKVIETQSWLVRPENNYYSYWNIAVHGITPDKTVDAPEFPEVWSKILTYLKETPVLVAHNAAFDISCIRKSLELFNLPTPSVNYFCTLRAARKLYTFESNTLDCVCRNFGIKEGTHHRAGDDAEMCARIFLHQIKDNGINSLNELNKVCGGVL